MPQLPGDVRRARAAELRAAGAREVRRFLDSQVGGLSDILLATETGGRSPQFAAVRLDGAPGGLPETPAALSPAIAGSIVTARIVARDDETLIARRAA